MYRIDNIIITFLIVCCLSNIDFFRYLLMIGAIMEIVTFFDKYPLLEVVKFTIVLLGYIISITLSFTVELITELIDYCSDRLQKYRAY